MTVQWQCAARAARRRSTSGENLHPLPGPWSSSSHPNMMKSGGRSVRGRPASAPRMRTEALAAKKAKQEAKQQEQASVSAPLWAQKAPVGGGDDGDSDEDDINAFADNDSPLQASLPAAERQALVSARVQDAARRAQVTAFYPSLLLPRAPRTPTS
jgi:hypothetical protein